MAEQTPIMYPPGNSTGAVFNRSSPKTPIIKVTAHMYGVEYPINSVPNNKVTSFEMSTGSSGMSGTIQFFDTFEQGFRKDDPEILYTLMKVINYTPPLGGTGSLKIQIGWSGDGVSWFSPVYNCIIVRADLKYEANGVSVILKFMVSGAEISSLQAKFEEDLDKGFLGLIRQKMTPGEVIKELIKVWNEKNQGTTIIKDVVFINSTELSNEQEIRKLDGFSCQGKTFQESIDFLLSGGNILPVQSDNKALNAKTYAWWFENLGGNLYIIVIGQGMYTRKDNGKDVANIKRYFSYRAGTKSDVISFSYTDSSPISLLLTGMLTTDRVKSYYIGKDGDKMRPISSIESSEITDSAKNINKDLRPNMTDTDINSGPKSLPNILKVDLSDINWQDKSDAGRAMWKDYMASVIQSTMGKGELEIVGDPNCIASIGGFLSYVQGIIVADSKSINSENLVERIAEDWEKANNFVMIGDVIHISVYNSNGVYNRFLSGNYIVHDISHNISFGKYTTKIKAWQDIPKERF